MAKDEPTYNTLRRNTAFTCNLKFRCSLPEPPCDPKLLIAPLQPERLAKFAITALERNPRRELLQEPEVGIHIGLLDTSQYAVTDPTATLAPEDLALLEGATVHSPHVKSSSKARDRLRGAKAELSWLMRTSYISNDSESKRQAAQIQKKSADAAVNNVNDDAGQLKEVEASFEAALRDPVHPTDPSLVPVEITPVLPDFERWGENYVLIDFEGDPTTDHASLTKLTPSRRQQLAGEAVVKSYALPGGGAPFLAYMVPKANSSTEEIDNDQTRAAGAGEYEWIREYKYEIANTKDVGSSSTYLLRMEDGVCKYLDLNTRMKCSKRTRSSQGIDPRAEFPRPSKISLSVREKTQEEILAADKLQEELMSMNEN